MPPPWWIKVFWNCILTSSSLTVVPPPPPLPSCLWFFWFNLSQHSLHSQTIRLNFGRPVIRTRGRWVWCQKTPVHALRAPFRPLSCLWLKWTKLAKKCYCCGCYCCCCYCCFCFTCERFCDLLQNKVEVNRCLRNFEFGCKRFIGSGKNGCFCVEPKTTSFA